MCWNAEISLNTFLFGCMTILFIYYTNTYTRYKSLLFDNLWYYIFLFVIISMQLLEYFIWKNIHNKSINQLLSKIGLFIIFLQPIFSIMTIGKNNVRNTLLFYYLLLIGIYLLYKFLFSRIVFETTVAKNGHLLWKWLEININNPYEYLFVYGWVFFLLYTLYFNKNYISLLLSILIFIVSFFTYLKSNTWGSMWCWVSNTMMFYFLFKILFVLPFYEYNALC